MRCLQPASNRCAGPDEHNLKLLQYAVTRIAERMNHG